MALIPPGVNWDATPQVHVVLNEQWATFVSGLLASGEAERYWTSDQYRGSQGIMSIQEALFGVWTMALDDQLAVLEHREDLGVAGGAFTSGAWQTRTLNTEVRDSGNLVQLGVPAANQFTVQPGLYLVLARCPGNLVDLHQARLFDMAAGAAVLVGTNARAGSADAVQTDSFVIGFIAPAVATAYRLEHRCSTTKTVNGFGAACGFTLELYAQIQLLRVGD